MTPTNTNLSQTHGWLPRKNLHSERKEREIIKPKKNSEYIYIYERAWKFESCLLLPPQTITKNNKSDSLETKVN